MSFDVSIAKDSDAELWSAFLNEQAPEIDTHAFDWRWRQVISSSFGAEALYLISKEKDEVSAICPCFFFKSPLFGKALISVPYLNGGGILSKSDGASDSILAELRKLSKDRACKYVELRERGETYFGKAEGVSVRTHKVSMKLPLRSDPDELFKTFPAKLRSQTRRPGKSGLIAKVSGKELSLQESEQAFWTVFSENMRDLGTPCFPRKLYQEIIRLFKDQTQIITVWDGEKPVAAGLTIGGSKKTVEVPWAASLRSYSKQSANMLLYWTMIKESCLGGYSEFDFGRSSPDAGTFKFKKQWGAEPLELHWHYLGEAPDVSPKSKKFEMMVSVWQKLPVPIANQLGQKVSSWIPG